MRREGRTDCDRDRLVEEFGLGRLGGRYVCLLFFVLDGSIWDSRWQLEEKRYREDERRREGGRMKCGL